MEAIKKIHGLIGNTQSLVYLSFEASVPANLVSSPYILVPIRLISTNLPSIQLFDKYSQKLKSFPIPIMQSIRQNFFNRIFCQ